MPENELNLDQNNPEQKLSGEILERWEILERIGEGGMSEVYRARHVIMNKLGAVKFLKADLSDDRAAVLRFQQEAMASASLGHSNIVQVYDCGLSDKGFYIILEFLEGVSLADILDDRAAKSEDGRGKMTVEEALPIFLAVCDGLEHAHEKGIVHRDMKPSNIMLVDKFKNGEKVSTEVKLVDFGIAKIVQSASGGRDVHSLTRTGEVFGSPLYMSPEQCMGKPLDGRADLYSVGCLIYETLTGRKAISGSNPTDTMMRHVQDVPELVGLTQLDHPHAERLKAIVAKCLEKSPDNRFSDMRQLYDALRELDDEPVAKLASRKPVAKAKSGTRSGAANNKPPKNTFLLITSLTALGLLLALTMGLAIYSLWPVSKINERALDLKTPLPPLTWSFPVKSESAPEQEFKIRMMSTANVITRSKDWQKNGGLKRLVQAYIDAGYFLANQRRYQKAGTFFDDALAVLSETDEPYALESTPEYKYSGNCNDKVRAATGEAYCYHAQGGGVLLPDDGLPDESDELKGERDLEAVLTSSKIKEGASHEALLQAYKVFATLLESHKNYSGSYSKLLEGVAVLPPIKTGKDNLERGYYVAHLAELARITEDENAAERHYEAAIGLLKKGLCEDHQLLADLLMRSGLNFMAQDDNADKYPKAHSAFMQAYNLYGTLRPAEGKQVEKVRQLKLACLSGAYEAIKHYDWIGSIVFRLQNGI
ncbi:MAG: serine/threonine protein kinase [Candidatus Obscuribacter sp.]|nr:serine/threonine protein kinase [Candidatus Obscuribacter sp.]